MGHGFHSYGSRLKPSFDWLFSIFLGCRDSAGSDGKRVSESAAFQCISVDLFEGKARGKPGFRPTDGGFAVNKSFSQSIEY